MTSNDAPSASAPPGLCHSKGNKWDAATFGYHDEKD